MSELLTIDAYVSCFNKVKNKLKKYSDEELKNLIVVNRKFYKTFDNINISNPIDIKKFITRTKKIDLTLRKKIEKLIENELAPFSDDIVKRDNQLMEAAITEIIIDRMFKSIKLKNY